MVTRKSDASWIVVQLVYTEVHQHILAELYLIEGFFTVALRSLSVDPGRLQGHLHFKLRSRLSTIMSKTRTTEALRSLPVDLGSTARTTAVYVTVLVVDYHVDDQDNCRFTVLGSSNITLRSGHLRLLRSLGHRCDDWFSITIRTTTVTTYTRYGLQATSQITFTTTDWSSNG